MQGWYAPKRIPVFSKSSINAWIERTKAFLADVVRQCLDALRSEVPLDDATVADYESQLATYAEQRARLQDAIARWWTLLGRDGAHYRQTKYAYESAPVKGTRAQEVGKAR